jgi:hypothetical protein
MTRNRRFWFEAVTVVDGALRATRSVRRSELKDYLVAASVVGAFGGIEKTDATRLELLFQEVSKP